MQGCCPSRYLLLLLWQPAFRCPSGVLLQDETTTYVHLVTGTRRDGYDQNVTLNVFRLWARTQTAQDFARLKPHYARLGLFAEWSAEKTEALTAMPSFEHSHKHMSSQKNDIAAGFKNGVLRAKHLILNVVEAGRGRWLPGGAKPRLAVVEGEGSANHQGCDLGIVATPRPPRW